MRKFDVLAGLLLLVLVACSQSTPPTGGEPTVQLPSTPVTPPAVAPAKDPAASDDSQAEARVRALIPKKQALSKKIWKAATTISDDLSVGTAFNEIDINEHTCFILGNLLGKEELVRKLEVKYQPDVTTATEGNAWDLRIMTVSLGNFIGRAEEILRQSRDKRVLEWNLDCVGRLGIPEAAYMIQTGQSTFYTVMGNGKVLRILGDIEAGFAKKVIDAIEANPGIDTVAMGSRGGHVYEALKTGDYIRKKGLKTELWNGCYSACPLVLMGGVQRSNWSPYPALGFHQISGPEGEATPLNSQVYEDVYRYLVAMDIDPRYVIGQMRSSSPMAMTVVRGNDDALCAAKIFTWVQRGCTSGSYR